jgi:outer membrane lipoprotein LolB
MGWPIPVEALQWWVRGLAAPGIVEDEQLDSQGLLTSLDQLGWRVEFNRYDSKAGVALPVRLDARRDNYRVKLAIGRWQLDTGDQEN